MNEQILETKYEKDYSKYSIGKYNKTTTFLLPSVGLGIFQIKTIASYLVNAYLEDESLEHNFERPVFVLFSISKTQEKTWNDFEYKLQKNPNYVYDYYVGTNEKETLIMYVFKVPEKWKDIYSLFKEGKYFEFDEDYKKIFPKEAINLGKIVESKVYGVLYKTQSLKEYLIQEFVIDPDDQNEFENTLNSMDNWWDLPDKKYEHIKFE